MATVVKMPKWGLTMTAGTVTDWLREEGSEVSEGDPLFTVETEKAVNDIEAPADGVLVKIVAGRGDEIPVSAAMAIIAAPGETLSDDEIAALVESASPAKAATAATPSSGGSGTSREARLAARDASGRINASPAARKLAQELDVDLAAVEATGPGGRITSDDVERAAATRADDPTPRRERITLDDGREIAVLIAGPGSGRKLVFVHGLGGSQSTWQVVLGALADRYRVIALDLPGHGDSDKSDPGSIDYGVAGLARAIGEVLESLQLDAAILVGHSLGGAVALQMALEPSARVRGLVLIDSAGLGEEIAGELLDLMSHEPGPSTARGLLELFFEDKGLVLDRGVDEMAAMQSADGAWRAQQAVAAAAFANGVQQDGLGDRLSDVRIPTLVLWGERDRVIPLHHATAALTRLPDVTLRVLPGIGHVPQVEAAPTVATSIDRFARGLG